jgi:hypothetical protein
MVPIQEVLDRSRDALSSKYCLHPDKVSCSGKIVQAHSIQRSGGLTKIARDGQVYSFLGNNVMDIEREKGLLAPKLVGVGKASTFTGFCGFHDNAVFSPIEKHPFTSTPEHALLLAYRHICKELFTKKAAREMVPLLRILDRGRSFDFQREHQESVSTFDLSRAQGLKDTEEIKGRYDKALSAKNFSEVRYYVVRFNEVPDLLCSSGHFPVYDFYGAKLQDLLDFGKTPDHVGFSLIVTDNGGAAVFSWLGNNPSSEQLVKSLHEKGDADLVQALVRYVFEFFENTYFSPIWWDALDEEVKSAIRHRFSQAVNPYEKRRPDCLKDDGIRAAHWTIVARETNLML